MKAIVVAFTLKGQDLEKILDVLENVQHARHEHILIHGFMPIAEVEKKGWDPALAKALHQLFPVQLNMYDGRPLREEMAEVAKKLDAEIVVIGEVRDGVAEEVELYKELGLKINYLALPTE